MFPKRLFLTALGALGLGALASGPAYSQQLPAPDLFADITACGGGADAAQFLKDAASAAAKAVTAAKDLQTQHMELTGSPDSPAGKLLTELLKGRNSPTEDDGRALVNAVSETHKAALDAKTKADEVADMIGDGDGPDLCRRVPGQSAQHCALVGDFAALTGQAPGRSPGPWAGTPSGRRRPIGLRRASADPAQGPIG